MSTIPDNYIAYLSVEQAVILPILTLSVMYFAYGIYVLLFGTYIYIIRSRIQTGERRNKNLYLILTVVLFGLSTIFVANQTAYFVHGAVVRFNVVKNEDYSLLERYQFYDDFWRRLGDSTRLFVAEFLNIAAEWMLIHRCYLIWGFNNLVAVPLIISSVLINACGLASCTMVSIGITNFATDTPSAVNLLEIERVLEVAYDIGVLVNNIIITLLTAGRIWWVHRQLETRGQGVYTSDKFVQSISRFILESGMIYPIVTMVDLIIANTIPFKKFPIDLFAIVLISAGIAPTLIMVRAKLGQNVESLREAVSDIRFTSQPAWQGLGQTTTTQ